MRGTTRGQKTPRAGRQGNRISDLSDDFSEEVVAPAGAVEFPAFGDFGCFRGDEIEGQVAQDGKDFRGHCRGGCGPDPRSW
jgi:hypothetical protein